MTNTSPAPLTLRQILETIQHLHAQKQYQQCYDIATQALQTFTKKSDIFTYIIASALHHLERYDEALKTIETIIDSTLHNKENIALLHITILRTLEHYQVAIIYGDKYTKLYPSNSEILFQLGAAYRKNEQLDQALLCQEKAYWLNNNSASILAGLAMVYNDLKQYDKAIYFLYESLRRDEGHVENWNFLSSLYTLTGDAHKALLYANHVLTLNPHHNDALVNRCIMLFSKGDFANGWAYFNDRWESKELKKYQQHITKKQWRGEGLSGRDLLVLDEQGVGDLLMFYGLLQPLEQQGVRLHLVCKGKILNHVKRSIKYASINQYSLEQFYNAFPDGYVTRLGDIAGIMQLYVNQETTYQPVPWMHYDVTNAQKIRHHLTQKFPNKILAGLSWHSKHKVKSEQNLNLHSLTPLFRDNPHIQWVNLQYGDQHHDDIDAFNTLSAYHLYQIPDINIYSDNEGAIDLTAALDFVVTTENTAGHFAGVIGKKTFLLLAKNCTWRWTWLNNDNQSEHYLWYKNHHLIRQQHLGEWDYVLTILQQHIHDYSSAIYQVRTNLEHEIQRHINYIDNSALDSMPDSTLLLHDTMPLHPLTYVLNGAYYFGKKHYNRAYYYLNLALHAGFEYNLIFYSLLANTCLYLQYFNESIDYFKKIIANEQPKERNFAYNNLGMVYLSLAQFDLAEQYCQQAIDFDDETTSQYSYNLSNIYMAQQRFQEAWSLYNTRFSTPKYNLFRRDYTIPMWQGEDLTNKTLLIQSEQGVGEQIMFAGFLQYFDTSMTAKTWVSCKYKLEKIFSRSLPYEILEHGQGNEHIYASHHNIDYYIPMGSIPYYIKLFSNKAITPKPFLIVQNDKQQAYKKKLQQIASGRKIIGISWYKRIARVNSMPIETLFPFASDEFLLVDLQYESTQEDLQRLHNFGHNIVSFREVSNYDDIDDFCAIIKACDHVVSIQNSTVHFAGALGVNTHVMLPKTVDWRWSYGYDYGIWYDDVHLYYQKNIHEWADVVERIKKVILTK